MQVVYLGGNHRQQRWGCERRMERKEPGCLMNRGLMWAARTLCPWGAPGACHTCRQCCPVQRDRQLGFHLPAPVCLSWGAAPGEELPSSPPVGAASSCSQRRSLGRERRRRATGTKAAMCREPYFQREVGWARRVWFSETKTQRD